MQTHSARSCGLVTAALVFLLAVAADCVSTSGPSQAVAARQASIRISEPKECLEVARVLVDWSAVPDATPNTQRAHAVHVARWTNGIDYLYANDGNGLLWWSLSDPLRPAYSGSRRLSCAGMVGCPVRNDGDEDWQLCNLSLCDGCRYAFASFGGQGAALVDLGTGSRPAATSAVPYAVPSAGGFTFQWDGEQYLITAGLPGGCNSATLWRIAAAGRLELVQCVRTDRGLPFSVAGGVAVGDVLYLASADMTRAVHTCQVHDPLRVECKGSEFSAIVERAPGLAVDLEASRLVTAMADVQLYDVSDPLRPEQLTGRPAPPFFNSAAIRWPWVWFASRPGAQAWLYDMSDPAAPREVDPGFWARTVPTRGAEWGAAFSRDGNVLYVARWTSVDVVDLRPCAGNPTPPGSIFADGFESGNEAAWSATKIEF